MKIQVFAILALLVSAPVMASGPQESVDCITLRISMTTSRAAAIDELQKVSSLPISPRFIGQRLAAVTFTARMLGRYEVASSTHRDLNCPPVSELGDAAASMRQIQQNLQVQLDGTLSSALARN
ncbi:hypothetical protein ACLF3G_29060 [Falsiroseomonas sp. HC035]|uniref:hypothetical protein n=1 Tax=Falsiroseomonas sp. HC035 TaxID=3390999 RepID=UPI003D31DA8C